MGVKEKENVYYPFILQWREEWAWGNSQWKYRLDYGSRKYSAKQAARDFAREEAEQYMWSDTFRGIEYHVLKRPAKETVSKLIESEENMIRRAEHRIRALKSIRVGSSIKQREPK